MQRPELGQAERLPGAAEFPGAEFLPGNIPGIEAGRLGAPKTGFFGVVFPFFGPIRASRWWIPHGALPEFPQNLGIVPGFIHNSQRGTGRKILLVIQHPKNIWETLNCVGSALGELKFWDFFWIIEQVAPKTPT